MKTSSLIIEAFTLVTAGTIWYSQAGRAFCQTPSSNQSVSSIPNDVYKIFEGDCIGCHKTGGKLLAVSKLNFTDWENYNNEKQMKKAEAICNMVTKGKMPPKAAREKHPEIIPTQAQVENICNWSKTFTIK